MSSVTFCTKDLFSSGITGVGLSVGVGVFVGVGVLVGVGVSVGTGVLVGVGVSVGIGVLVGIGVGASVGDTIGVGGTVSVGPSVSAGVLPLFTGMEHAAIANTIHIIQPKNIFLFRMFLSFSFISALHFHLNIIQKYCLQKSLGKFLIFFKKVLANLKNMLYNSVRVSDEHNLGLSPNGKATDSDSVISRFESL